MRKGIEIILSNKNNGNIQKLYCHHFAADSRAYYLKGVKGFKDSNIVMAFNKAEWERL